MAAADKTVKTQRLKGFSDLGYFKSVINTAESYTVTPPRVKLEGAYTASKTDNKTTTNIPADDNAAWDTENEWEDTTLTIAVRGMLLADLATLQGAETVDGEMIETIYDIAPEVALNFIALNANGGYRCFAYFVAQLQTAQVSHQTKGGGTTLQDYTLDFRCKGRAADGSLRAVKDVATYEEAAEWLETVSAYPGTSPIAATASYGSVGVKD